jgi:hypothetical protein
MQRKSK